MLGDIRERLSEALSRVDRPGSFCVEGSAPGVLPGLEVEGLGPVGLPLTARQAKELIRHCRQAPHGQGEKTVVDTSVRRAWKLEPGRFSTTNPDWDRFLGETVAEVQEGLGLEKQKLESHPYDLLLYEPGGFFLPHRDGEKLDRMVATLVVVLPSSHEGGELVVRHDGQERTVDFRGADGNPLRIHYAAFYADCEHEIRPITKGYRLCLVYNLTLAKSRKKVAPPRSSGPVESVSRILEEWSADDSAGKLAITLEHQYTRDGLDWDALKGEDRARAEVLREAARQAGCVASLALLTLYESGEGEETRYRSRYRRRWESDDDDEGGEYEMGEVYETRLSAAPRMTGDGQMLPVGDLSVDEEEVLDPDMLKEVTPEEEFEGYTGNEGMTLERWYRHAAIVLWPGRRHFEVLCERDGRRVIPVLKDWVARWKKARGEVAATLKVQGLELAAAILKNWKRPADRYASWSSAERYSPALTEVPKADDLLEALDELGEPGPIGRFFGELMVADASVDPGKALGSTCQKYGWSTFLEPLRALMQGTTSESLARNVRLLEQLATARPRKKEGWEGLCATLAQDLVSAIEAIDKARGPDDWYAPKGDRGEILAGLARSLLATEQHELLARLAAHALASPKKYPLTPDQMSAWVALRPWLGKHVKAPVPALTRWLASCREQLESLTARIPQEPRDYRRAANVTCQCAECGELKRFLEDPNEATHRFRAREKIRDHLEHQIRDRKFDLDLVTERTGSPHTLVCTKNVASYRARLKKYHEDLEHLATLRAIEAGLPG